MATRAERLRRKNRHNLITVLLWLASLWVFFFITTIGGYVMVMAFPMLGAVSLAAFSLVMLVLGILFRAVTERATLGFKPLEPRTVPILDPYFWWHERHWKFVEPSMQNLFTGTPFKNTVSRLFGINVGRKVFDDGAC